MGGSKQNHAIRSCLFLSFLLSTSLDLRICKKKGCDVFPPNFAFLFFGGQTNRETRLSTRVGSDDIVATN